MNNDDKSPKSGAAPDPSLRAVALAKVERIKAERAEVKAVQDARAKGVSWRRIGEVYGLTKQGAQQRFGSRQA